MYYPPLPCCSCDGQTDGELGGPSPADSRAGTPASRSRCAIGTALGGGHAHYSAPPSGELRRAPSAPGPLQELHGICATPRALRVYYARCSSLLRVTPARSGVCSGSLRVRSGPLHGLHAATHGSVHSGCNPQSSERSAVLLVYSRNSACAPCRCGHTPPHSASAPRLLRVAPPCSGPAPHPLRIAPRPLRARSAPAPHRSARAPHRSAPLRARSASLRIAPH